ncbi:MAG: DUF4845 domain-containing protein [Halomonadaceae bacterium]|nr:MAG: DUF4845 domain-containing protein [Halomonadaceae bacterium]
MKQQQGASALSFLVVVFILLSFLTIAIRLVPVYFDDYSVKKLFSSLEESGQMQGASIREAQALVKRRQDQNNLNMFGQEQLKIRKDNGVFLIDLDYEVRVPMVGNVDAIVHFTHNYELRAQ